MDRNNDGYISREEARDATWNNRFSELDKDNDGRISQSEFNALGAGSSAGSSTTGGMGGSVGPGGTQSGSSTSGVGDKPGQKQ
jgi:Ca2+-binding EF-hand superfamily protein